MTNAQSRKWHQFYERMKGYGFTYEEADALRRIEMTLSRWSEAVCNGDIERDGYDGDGPPRRYFTMTDGSRQKGYIVQDRERGAMKRLAKIMVAHEPDLIAYNQGDPRGCSLYIVRRKDIPEGGDIGSYYTRGVAVCL